MIGAQWLLASLLVAAALSGCASDTAAPASPDAPPDPDAGPGTYKSERATAVYVTGSVGPRYWSGDRYSIDLKQERQGATLTFFVNSSQGVGDIAFAVAYEGESHGEGEGAPPLVVTLDATRPGKYTYSLRGDPFVAREIAVESIYFVPAQRT